MQIRITKAPGHPIMAQIWTSSDTYRGFVEPAFTCAFGEGATTDEAIGKALDELERFYETIQTLPSIYWTRQSHLLDAQTPDFLKSMRGES